MSTQWRCVVCNSVLENLPWKNMNGMACPYAPCEGHLVPIEESSEKTMAPLWHCSRCDLVLANEEVEQMASGVVKSSDRRCCPALCGGTLLPGGKLPKENSFREEMKGISDKIIGAFKSLEIVIEKHHKAEIEAFQDFSKELDERLK